MENGMKNKGGRGEWRGAGMYWLISKYISSCNRMQLPVTE